MRTPTRRPAGAAIALFAAIVMGCQGGGGDGGGGVTPPAPGITVSLSTASLSVTQGLTGTIQTTVTRRNGFAGDVDLIVEGAPDGVTATLTPAKIPAGSTSGSLDIAVAHSVNPGTYTLTIRGRAVGVTDHAVTLSLTVGVSGSYNLSVSPATVTVQQGSSGATTLTIERIGGFAGAVALTVSGAPAGVTVVPSPVAVTGTSVSLVITAAASAAPGSYTITVTGTASGLADRTTTFGVQVTATGGTSVTFKFCGPDIPTWLAVQSEGGAWVRIAGVANSYTASLGSRGAVAAVMGFSGSFQTTVIYASTAELVAIGQASVADCAAPSYGSRHLSGTVANLGTSAVASIALGDALTTVEANGPSTFALDNAPDAASDLVAARQGITASAMLSDKLIIRRGLNLPNGSAIPVLDFASSEAVAPVTASATLTNLGADSAMLASALVTATNTIAPLSETYGTSQQSFSGLPGGQLTAGDLHEVLSIALPPGESEELRGIDAYLRVVSDQTLAFGPSLAIPTISTTSFATPQRLRTQLAVQSAYSKNIAVDFFQGSSLFGPSHEVMLYVTAAYAGGSPTTWDVTIPDLSAAGFDATWGLTEGSAVSWTVMATNFATLAPVGILPADGTRQTFAARGSAGATLDALRTRSRRTSLLRPLPLRMSPLRSPARARR